MPNKHLADKPISNGTTTTSLGTSSSAHITEESSGHVGIDDRALLPNIKSSKWWEARTDTTMDLEPDKK